MQKQMKRRAPPRQGLLADKVEEGRRGMRQVTGHSSLPIRVVPVLNAWLCCAAVVGRMFLEAAMDGWIWLQLDAWPGARLCWEKAAPRRVKSPAKSTASPGLSRVYHPNPSMATLGTWVYRDDSPKIRWTNFEEHWIWKETKIME